MSDKPRIVMTWLCNTGEICEACHEALGEKTPADVCLTTWAPQHYDHEQVFYWCVKCADIAEDLLGFNRITGEEVTVVDRREPRAAT